MYKPQWCSDSIAYLRRLPPMWKREQKLVLLFGDYRSNLSISSGSRVDELSFFAYLSTFCFLSIEFHCTFSHFL